VLKSAQFSQLTPTAWIAGPGDPDVEQKFDVWLAFEFAPLLARSIGLSAKVLPTGIYTVKSVTGQDYAIVKDGDSTDDTPIVLISGAKSGEGHHNINWQVRT
jgi:hypothetical protein